MPENLLRSSRIRPQGKFSLHQKVILQFKSSREKFSHFYDDFLKLFELSSSTFTLPDDGPVVGASAHLVGRPLPTATALAPPPSCFIQKSCPLCHHCHFMVMPAIFDGKEVDLEWQQNQCPPSLCRCFRPDRIRATPHSLSPHFPGRHSKEGKGSWCSRYCMMMMFSSSSSKVPSLSRNESHEL